jgi:SAM-dependent methyltransferase
MGLVALADIASLLICPRCRSRLITAGGAFRCSSPSCALSVPGSFPSVGRWPVFVDFDRSVIRPPSESQALRAGSAGLLERRRWSIDRVPPQLRRWWKPRNAAAARNVELLLTLMDGSSRLVVVIGGGTMGNGIDALYRDQKLRVIGFDIYGTPLTHFIADAHQIPLASGSVDAVVIQAVLEHVIDPGMVVGEIHRILRRRGLVYAETPFLQQVHAGPYDFVRYTSSGHRYLFRAFEEVAAGPVSGPGTQLLWSMDHVVRGVARSELAGKLARGFCFWLRYLDRLVPTEFAMDSASAYYFIGRRSDHELTPHEIIEYYRGAQRIDARTHA